MSVNLKGRKSAKSEQAEAPAPQELVMAGAQTPWATELPAGGAVSNPFAEGELPPGMPTMPPPPPPFAPGEEEAEAEADGKKSPLSKPMVLALAAVIAVGGGGYYFLNSGSSSTPTPVAKTHVLTPAQLAALRAKAAAKPTTAAAAAGAAKPTTVKAAAPAKTTTGKTTTGKTTTPAKATTGKTATGKTTTAKPGTTKDAAAGTTTAVFTAALPGTINGWDKLVGAKVPDTLASYDATVGASVTDTQQGLFGGSASDPYLGVTVANHSKNAKGKAIDVLREVLTFDRDRGIAVSAPFFVSHAGWGGSAACATEAAYDKSGTSDESVVVCAWIDANTVGVIQAPHRIASQALPLLRSVRSQVEK